MDLTTHMCPRAGSDLTLCCGKSPLELPVTDRLATDPLDVTCVPWSSRNVHEALAEHLMAAFAAAGELMVTHWVLVAETMDADGALGVWALAKEGQAGWETLGLLEYGRRKETAGGEL